MKLGLFVTAAAAAALACAAPASAAIFLAFVPGGSSPDVGQTVIEDFETGGALIDTGVSFGYQIKAPPSDSAGAVIPTSTFPGSHYLSVLGGGSATLKFGPSVGRFSFDWGSLDDYNTLKITYNGGSTVTAIPGTTILNTPANGNQFLPGTNGKFVVVGTAGETFNKITLTSGTNSFEIDNVAVGGVPEPATWGMMILGFGTAGAILRRRRTVLA